LIAENKLMMLRLMMITVNYIC